MEKKKISIYVVTHKNINHKIKLKNYYYIGVGSNKDINADVFDNDGEDNISNKNNNYCELTAQYWIWKNDNSDIVGLCHYRRFFYNSYLSFFYNLYLKSNKIEKILNNYDIIVPKKFCVKNEKINTIYEQYCDQHYKKDIDNVREIIKSKYYNYLKAFDTLMNSSDLRLFNMVITSKKIFDEYSEFLFGVLFELEKITDLSEYNNYQKRIYGFLGERLINVFLLAHPEYKIKEQSVVFLSNKIVIFEYIKNIIKKLFFIKEKVIYYPPNK